MKRRVYCDAREVKELVIDMRAREWCKMTYPGHPNGCPNYDHKDT